MPGVRSNQSNNPWPKRGCRIVHRPSRRQLCEAQQYASQKLTPFSAYGPSGYRPYPFQAVAAPQMYAWQQQGSNFSDTRDLPPTRSRPKMSIKDAQDLRTYIFHKAYHSEHTPELLQDFEQEFRDQFPYISTDILRTLAPLINEKEKTTDFKYYRDAYGGSYGVAKKVFLNFSHDLFKALTNLNEGLESSEEDPSIPSNQIAMTFLRHSQITKLECKKTMYGPIDRQYRADGISREDLPIKEISDLQTAINIQVEDIKQRYGTVKNFSGQARVGGSNHVNLDNYGVLSPAG